jgi:hypothetical protein
MSELFDPIIELESKFIEEGRKEGIADGIQLGISEGLSLGTSFFVWRHNRHFLFSIFISLNSFILQFFENDHFWICRLLQRF